MLQCRGRDRVEVGRGLGPSSSASADLSLLAGRRSCYVRPDAAQLQLHIQPHAPFEHQLTRNAEYDNAIMTTSGRIQLPDITPRNSYIRADISYSNRA